MAKTGVVERKVFQIEKGVSLEGLSEGDIIVSLGRRELVKGITDFKLNTLARYEQDTRIYLLERDFIDGANQSEGPKFLEFYDANNKDYEMYDKMLKGAEL